MDDRLIQAALECVAAYGYRKTSLSDVAARAGVSRATVYRAFGSKDRMGELVVRHEGARFIEQIAEIFASAAPPEEQIARSVEFALEFTGGHDVLQRMLMEEPEELFTMLIERPGHTAFITFLTQGMTPFLAAGPHAHLLRVTPEQAVEFTTRVILSLIAHPTTSLGGSAEIARFIWAAIGRPASPA
ncbi:TetR/AcrR family transcriptional regulator [Nonomuraea sp. NPDC050790]|uniref:TetR/AcrR family transcriptional regulator n=1 Tax=Nonomuraea sp. NPDC050790 TaxID=3364371 RepID=UPI0037AABC28